MYIPNIFVDPTVSAIHFKFVPPKCFNEYSAALVLHLYILALIVSIDSTATFFSKNIILTNLINMTLKSLLPLCIRSLWTIVFD